MPPHEWLSMYEADLATKKWPGGPTCVFLSTWSGARKFKVVQEKGDVIF